MPLLSVFLTSLLAVTQVTAQELSPKKVAAQSQAKNTELVKPTPKPPEPDPGLIIATIIVACSTTTMLLVLALSDR